MLIKAKNRSGNNIYIQAVTLNGAAYHKTYIDHTTLLSGGTLEFTLGAKPNKQFGNDSGSWPASASNMK